MKKEWRKFKGHIGYQQVDCFTHYGVPESEERKRTREFIQSNNDWKHLKSREEKSHIDPGSSKQTSKQTKQKKPTLHLDLTFLNTTPKNAMRKRGSGIQKTSLSPRGKVKQPLQPPSPPQSWTLKSEDWLSLQQLAPKRWWGHV